ncbi:UDP-N-acetylmuramoyl-tripeptide--D-alanyl-D-alanine ligase [Lactococcus formosensis]|jgi:UDP-N-acetylmuramoyl-tripeptide--D-alanyl-D-alanine ligase|uniref:UDP-N-acetylmuramoyl-tripeptide--D-alanyl-D-alanine ligase n=1 Tax=Lactococcus formosensis TaxID=1281486 RepID=A0A9X4P6R6_9LACT|nr:UDP-N-acetylmuramoyl-tripeptide--D-alanyl-D-alanine ligase [Lactococcus formosensis]MDG6141957.1 UDP-N-acetylmuramoyl-tripeptide--D-alanyl-D-alanine ligase [Lactococcus formosensis]MDG6156548.1 UDP-N-acetylmuramoyl-tripeptide--D-alanyl-D-alanine ligase [Lactococcus formosensis]MDG6159161.1 UDP-N-acetylmuramoyl-tripeptide--D-alanyl-D-alanine ligase [Lactococcus formosensis]MDG6166767.1 UDP-N-acetylmuramoyl-tripeptide--D-alanyl-D-alanine ligase [Lactococcus formosensis]MDG6171849.1 UDP-N-acet
MKLTLHEIAHIVGATNNWSELADTEIHNIEFDSRKIQGGDLFLPLKGARDGHEFIDTAFAQGALATFAEQEVAQPHLRVEDCLEAFQKLAQYYLEKTAVEVIAVTGSNGKTTTKDMIHAVLSEKYKTYKTQGNYNNEIGMPYTILHMPDDTEKIVLEMGMDRLGDIDLLSKIAKPRIAIVTLIGESHLEFFGTRDKIAEGKLGIKAGLRSGGELIVPADKIINKYLPADTKITRFGPDEDIFVTQLIEHKNQLSFTTNFLNEEITIPVPGKFNATNAMLAAYVGTLLDVEEDDIRHALSHVSLTRNRTEWKKASNGADILSDVYNANPTAMKLILETFQAIPKNEGGRKLTVLADMLELGDQAPELHASIAAAIDFSKMDHVYLYGDLMKYLLAELPEDKVSYFGNLEQLTEELQSTLQPQDQLLLKGSNSMKLGTIVEELQN